MLGERLGALLSLPSCEPSESRLARRNSSGSAEVEVVSIISSTDLRTWWHVGHARLFGRADGGGVASAGVRGGRSLAGIAPTTNRLRRRAAWMRFRSALAGTS